MSQRLPSNLRTLPQSIPELSPHVVLKTTPDGGGYAVTMDCQHTVWSAIEPGKTMHCGACASNFIDQLRAKRRE